jgi:hypothetical protein
MHTRFGENAVAAREPLGSVAILFRYILMLMKILEE